MFTWFLITILINIDKSASFEQLTLEQLTSGPFGNKAATRSPGRNPAAAKLGRSTPFTKACNLDPRK
jgi:hypothetical protein